MEIELIGGPLDGLKIDVPDETYNRGWIRVPLPSTPTFVHEPELNASLDYDTVVYEKTKCFPQWDGPKIPAYRWLCR